MFFSGPNAANTVSRCFVGQAAEIELIVIAKEQAPLRGRRPRLGGFHALSSAAGSRRLASA